MNTNEDDQLWLTEECPRCEGSGTIWNEIMRGYIMCIKCAGTGWYSFRVTSPDSGTTHTEWASQRPLKSASGIS